MGCLNLSIADIHFAISFSHTAELREVDPGYSSFCDTELKYSETIDVRLHAELPAAWNIEEFDRIFATGRSWAMYRRGKERILTIDPPGFGGHSLCVVRFDQSTREVAVYYNSKLLKKTENGFSLPNPFFYPLDRLLMMYVLAQRKGAMFHSAGIEIEGKGYMFAGLSGTGKSTLSRQFILQKGPVVLSDERVVIRKISGGFKAFGTPWPGDARIAVNRGVGLSGIFFIGHGRSNSIQAIGPADAMKRLLPLISIPWYDAEIMLEMLIFYEDLISCVPAYSLFFTEGGAVVDVLNEFACSTEKTGCGS